MAKNIAIAYSMKKKKKEDKLEKGRRQHDELQEKRGERYGKESTGVHSASYSHGNDRGASIAGSLVRGATPGAGGKRYYKGDEKIAMAKEEHARVLGELVSDKKDRKNLADGGAVGCPKCGYSEGGAIANDTDMSACEMPNEFDALVLSGGLEADDDHDIVKRAMKRKYK